MKSPALVSKLKSFAGKIADGFDSAIGNSVTVDNANNLASAASMMKRKNANTPVPTSRNAPMGNKQKTFGVPGAK